MTDPVRVSPFTPAVPHEGRPTCPGCGAQNRPRADGQGDVTYILIDERGHCECTVCSALWIHRPASEPL